MASKTVVGRLAAVPEVRAAGSAHVASFRVAETKRKFDREQNKWVDDFTIWHNVESWQAVDGLAALAKGTLVVVEGEERDGSYESRETGKRVDRVVLRARSVGVVVQDARASSSGGGSSWGASSGEPF